MDRYRLYWLLPLWISFGSVWSADFLATEEVWIRNTAPDTTYNADFLEARRTSEIRYGLAQFDLRSLKGQRITGVELVLDELSSNEGAGSSAEFPVETRAVAIAVDDVVPDLLAMTWNHYQSSIEEFGEEPFLQLGSYSLPAPGAKRSDQISIGDARDLEIIERVIQGHGILTLVLQPGEAEFPIAASFGDGELNGRDAVLRVILGHAVFEGVSTIGNRVVVFELKDGADSTIDLDKIELGIDGELVVPEIEKDGLITRLTFTPTTPFSVASEHEFDLRAIDDSGVDRGLQGTFTIGIPSMPLSGLPGPEGTSSGWGLRQIWDAGPVDSLNAALRVATEGLGTMFDSFVSSIHHFEPSDPGLGGPIPGDQALPAESQGLTRDDFVIVGHVSVSHAGGDLSIGVHTDDGFGLRMIGAEFNSVHGEGRIDSLFPSIMLHPGNTSDSDTRGILRDLPAGEYAIEFISWDHTGGAYFQVYAARGAFESDFANPDNWYLIGDPDGPLIPQASQDSDEDGMVDAYERANGLDPSKDDAADDLDGDGLSNLREHDLLTLANVEDSDGDGLSDGVEDGSGVWRGPTNTGTDPLRRDSDRDGFRDGAETNTGVFQSLDDTGTDPNRSDSDQDGVGDAEEIRLGSNASDPNSRSGAITSLEEIWIRSVSPEQTFNSDFLDARRTDEIRYGLVQFDLSAFAGETIAGVELVLDEVPLSGGAGSGAELPIVTTAAVIGVHEAISGFSALNWTRYQDLYEGEEDGVFETLGAYDLPAPESEGGLRRTVGSPADLALAQGAIDGSGILTIVLKPADIGQPIAASFGDGELRGADPELIVHLKPSVSDFIPVEIHRDRVDATLSLRWTSELGAVYRLEESEDLQAWSAVGVEMEANATETIIRVNPSPEKQINLYRVRKILSP